MQAVAADRSSAYLEMFDALTGLHAVHVLGGLGPLAIVTVAAFSGRYSRKKNAAVRYTAIYWHFLAAVWCGHLHGVYVDVTTFSLAGPSFRSPSRWACVRSAIWSHPTEMAFPSINGKDPPPG